MAKLSTSLNTQSWEDTHPISSHKPGRSNSSPSPYLLPSREVYKKEGGNCYWKLCLPNEVQTLCVPSPPPAGPGSLCSSGRGPERQPVRAAETEAERESLPSELLETTGASASVEVHAQPRMCLYSLCTLTCASMYINVHLFWGCS